MIRLGPKLLVPAAEMATQVVAALGMRGSGKSTVMTVICEGLLAAKIQVVILDYVGIHFGLRLAPDGKHPSPFEIPIIGGPHGDVALLPTAGKVVAEALAQSGSPAVLDVSTFRKGDRVRFATDFAENFFDTKKLHPGPCFLVLEESQRFIPQVIRFKGTGLERCLGAFEEIAEVGRNFGIGLGLLSQRPQKINKDVLNLAELVFAFQANGVHERKAIAEWVQEKGAEGRDEVMGELPSLRRGQDGVAEAIVWSPAWLKIYGKYTFAMKSTYDAGKTPTHARATIKMQPLDLDALKESMAAVVEQAKENDPRLAQAEIARLKKELARLQNETPPKTIEVPFIPQNIAIAIDEFERTLPTTSAISKKVGQLLSDAQAVERASNALLMKVRQITTKPKTFFLNERHELPRTSDHLGPVYASSHSRCARKILSVLTQRYTATASQAAILSGYSITSSTFANALSELRTAGLMTGSRHALVITEAGRTEAGPVEPLPTGRELLAYWQKNLGQCEARMLQVLWDRKEISREELSEETGYRMTSSTFANGLSKLRVLELMTGRGSEPLRIAETFEQ